ncbi:MAG: hypothetical protein K0U68_10115 [Gammaproteobacteria bacterium]|nr:hypothetical protein [Gammaproteobacteria bacterium]
MLFVLFSFLAPYTIYANDFGYSSDLSNQNDVMLHASERLNANQLFTIEDESSSPAINSPLPDSTLTGGAETFTWTTNGVQVLQWLVVIGDALGKNNYFSSGYLNQSIRSITVTSLPANDSILFVRLWYRTGSGWQSTDVQYTAADPSSVPAIINPVANSILADGTQTFEWTANGVNVLKWQLYIGHSIGSSNFYRSEELSSSSLSTTVAELPRDSRTLYVRLWYLNSDYQWLSKDYEYTADSGAMLPTITAPIPDSTLGSVETFTWTSNGTHVLKWLLYVGDTLGASNLHHSGTLYSRTRSVTAYNLPTDNSTLYVRLWFETDAGWQSVDAQYTAADPSTAPAIISPVANSILADGTQTFEWAANGVNVLQWQLYIGDSVGSSNFYRSEQLPGANLSTTVTGLPRDSRTLYMRLWYLNEEYKWQSKDYQYTSASGATMPTINAPVPDNTLTGSIETFTWTPNGNHIFKWLLYVGDALGANNLYRSYTLPSSARSATVYNLPTDESTVYVRLWYQTDTGWHSVDAQYTAANPSTAPAIISPVANSILTDDTQTFEWTANGVNVLKWQLYIGDSFGSNNIYRGEELPGTSLSTTLTGLPRDSRTLHVRLWYLNEEYRWQSKDYEYTSASGATIPTINAPVPDSTLTGSVETFTWTPNGNHVLKWLLYVGDALGENNLYKSSNLPSSARSVTVYNLPTDESTLYVRLLYETDAGWHTVDAQYTAADPSTAPAIINPVANSILADGTQTFEWTANGVNVLQWLLYIGDSVGSGDLYRSEPLPGSTLSTAVSGLPKDSDTLYVRLWYLNEEYRWQWKDYQYTATSGAMLPTINSPVPDSTLTGTTETFTWDANGTRVFEWWLSIGDSVGDNNLYDSGSLSLHNKSVTVINLPPNNTLASNSLFYVRLWYRTGADVRDRDWQYTDVQYSAASSSTAPEITNPVANSVLTGDSQTFDWTTNGVDNILYWTLWIGDSTGSNNFYSSGILPSSSLSTIANGLPTDGSFLYVRLWYSTDGFNWQWRDFEYIAISGAMGP